MDNKNINDVIVRLKRERLAAGVWNGRSGTENSRHREWLIRV
jgi:hypothetical protein